MGRLSTTECTYLPTFMICPWLILVLTAAFSPSLGELILHDALLWSLLRPSRVPISGLCCLFMFACRLLQTRL